MERYTLSSIAGLDPAAVPRPRFNIARGQEAPVVVLRDGARTIASMRWGMLSPWRGHGGKRGVVRPSDSSGAIASVLS